MSQSPPPPPSEPSGPLPAQSPVPASDAKGFLGRIFDLSFSEFVTPSLIKIIFVLGIVLAGIMSLIVFASLANQGNGGVVAGLIVTPLILRTDGPGAFRDLPGVVPYRGEHPRDL